MPPLKRSASMRTTLSMVMKKTSKYKYFLSLFNVAILLASLVLLVSGAYLKISYMMDSFDFIDANFKVVPYMLIVLGSFMFVVSAISFIGFGTDYKLPYIIIAVIMGILSLTLLVGAYLTLDVRSTISKEAFEQEIGKVDYEARNRYNNNNTEFRAKWDYIQREMRCCGFGRRGFEEYGSNIPKACFINPADEVKPIQNACKEKDLFYRIYNEGCFEVMKRKYQKRLPFLLLLISAGMAVTAIIGIVNVALAAAFVAQLVRKAKGFDVSQGEREAPPSHMRMESFQ